MRTIFTMQSAHPRACGENVTLTVILSAVSGSSPRVRGKPPSRRLQRPRPRLIPARAGKTSAKPPPTPPARAHPRACGENLGTVTVSWRWSGSSPRVRGKQGDRGSVCWWEGLIPARAGKTLRGPSWPAALRAHPRACGENPGGASSCRRRSGSSPRVRGKPVGVRARGLVAGLIPARAGKTSPDDEDQRCARAHPRACGENAAAISPAVMIAGSSPRVRGKLNVRGGGGTAGRLIPARAGKTSAGNRIGWTTAAHPRACGENANMLIRECWERGSSPRVRGKRSQRRRRDEAPRLIPARAGKTLTEARASFVTWAHPRACGENFQMGMPRSASWGSSPRVRGKLEVRRDRNRSRGLIPARAGKTARA